MTKIIMWIIGIYLISTGLNGIFMGEVESFLGAGTATIQSLYTFQENKNKFLFSVALRLAAGVFIIIKSFAVKK